MNERLSALLDKIEAQIRPALWDRLVSQSANESEDSLRRRMYALVYRQFGWTVVPAERPIFDFGYDPEWPEISCSCRNGSECASPGKHPAISWKANAIRALPSLERVGTWFLSYREANIAILTGDRSDGLLVMDIDPRRGGSLATLKSHGWPVNTVTEETGGHGLHLFYHAPGVPSVPGYGEGLEIKARGALVISAPSIHAFGTEYSWLPKHAPWEIALAELPAEVLQDIYTSAPSIGSAESGGPVEPGDWRDIALTREQIRVIALKRYRKAIWRVREDGQPRNKTMYWLARQLQALGMREDDIYAWVEAFGELVKNG